MRENKAITLITLVITIILLLILAGIAVNLAFGEHGIIQRAQEVKISYEEQEAREKLELVLLDLQAGKVENEKYNENEYEYIKKKIEQNGMAINGDIVFVDGWQFEIDRSVPKIGISLGKGKTIIINAPYIGTTSFTIKVSHIYKETDVELYTYVIDGIEIQNNLDKEYKKNDLEAESTHEVKVIAKYKNGDVLESNMITIKTKPRTYLIKEGTNTNILEWEQHPKTAQYQRLILPQKKDGYISFEMDGVNYTICGIVSTTKFDLTPYKKICWDAEESYIGNNMGTQLCIANTKETYPNFVDRISMYSPERKVRDLELTNLNDSYYISAQTINSTGYNMYARTYDIWLEE